MTQKSVDGSVWLTAAVGPTTINIREIQNRTARSVIRPSQQGRWTIHPSLALHIVNQRPHINWCVLRFFPIFFFFFFTFHQELYNLKFCLVFEEELFVLSFVRFLFSFVHPSLVIWFACSLIHDFSSSSGGKSKCHGT